MAARRSVHLVEAAPRQSLRAHVTTSLRSAIVTGELEPGVVYSAPSLAATFGVSATPVREAMLDLIREGLVSQVPNKGYRVTVMSDEDLDQITDVRMLLEPAGVVAATARVTAEDLERLRTSAREMVGWAERDDLRTYLDLDRAFHLSLLEKSGNARLVDIVRDLRTQTRLYGMRALAEGHRLAESAAEHVELVELMAAGDAEGAGSLMRRHLRHVRGQWALREE